jgi:hypothetical protein
LFTLLSTKMKNTLTIIFSFYFFLTSVGFVFGKHYCGNKVSSSIWGISISKVKACGCSHDGAGHKKNCCKSESKWVKSSTDISKTQASIQITKLNFSNSFFLYCIFSYNFNSTERETYFEVSHSPPPKSNPLFLLNRSLII